MLVMHEFLATAPFDLYELYLFHLVVKHRSFTKAAGLAGLTQSAITRQMQGIESALGVDLLERTTRSVRLTAAGEFLAPTRDQASNQQIDEARARRRGDGLRRVGDDTGRARQRLDSSDG